MRAVARRAEFSRHGQGRDDTFHEWHGLTGNGIIGYSVNRDTCRTARPGNGSSYHNIVQAPAQVLFASLTPGTNSVSTGRTFVLIPDPFRSPL